MPAYLQQLFPFSNRSHKFNQFESLPISRLVHSLKDISTLIFYVITKQDMVFLLPQPFDGSEVPSTHTKPDHHESQKPAETGFKVPMKSSSLKSATNNFYLPESCFFQPTLPHFLSILLQLTTKGTFCPNNATKKSLGVLQLISGTMSGEHLFNSSLVIP